MDRLSVASGHAIASTANKLREKVRDTNIATQGAQCKVLKQQQLHAAALYPFISIVLYLGLATNCREMLTTKVDRRQ
jgi:hypothetical protein